ncbi:YbaB/EbfC family nucleoid-associated protein [Actinophytocola sp.]|uniref:YbaB/EbfC family nucleoid-associated protein n=1 Tax=Actinophytocola sp. TaxID=1872138 RepID=UPI003D6AB933
MTDPPAEYEARLAAAQRRAEQIRDGLERVRATERSDDGQITVTVNSSGNVVDLELGPRDRSGPELAADILRTIRAAQANLADAVHTTMAPTFEGSELLAELDEQYRTAYPAPEPAPKPGPPRPDEDTDHEGRNLLS